MDTRAKVCLIIGVVLLLVGIGGFALGISQFDDDQLLLKVQKFYNQDYWLRHWLLDKDIPDFIKDEGVDLG